MNSLLDLLFKVIALGIGSAMSPVIFAIALALLSGKNHAKPRILAFLAGGVVVLTILWIAGYAIGRGALESGVKTIHPSASVDLLIGILLTIFGIIALIKKTDAEKGGKYADSKTSDAARLGKWFLIGFAANITNLDAETLFVTAVKEVFETNAALLSKIILSSISALFLLSPVLLPMAVYAIAPRAAQRMLRPLGNAMRKWGGFIAAVIFFAFGTYFLWKGIFPV
ncbi:GAP family protein [Candidatus Micrarchaeota archaeon]|nr:GAP family protein [Candidatus Micrarchaeota archaeon]